MKYLNCVVFLLIISFLSFFLGRILPKNAFHADRFPYKPFKFEKNGKVYEKIHIRQWQNKVPDMSRILPFMMPAKKMSGDYSNKLPRMIQETCVAEFIHGLNSLLGLACIAICPDIGGVIIALVYALVLNVPFMLIQRYNRPRLVALSKQIEKREKNRKNPVPEEVDTQRTH